MNKKQIIIDYDEYLEMENLIKYYKESEQNYCKYMDNATTEVEEYKKNFDKAIEYINSTDFIYDEQYKKKDKLENILTGGDDNE